MAVCAWMRSLAEVAAQEAKRNDEKTWKEWARQALEKGGGKSHRNAKRFAPWRPGAVSTPQGPTSEPHVVLASHAESWRKIWKGEVVGRSHRSVPALPHGVVPRGLEGASLHRPSAREKFEVQQQASQRHRQSKWMVSGCIALAGYPTGCCKCWGCCSKSQTTQGCCQVSLQGCLCRCWESNREGTA